MAAMLWRHMVIKFDNDPGLINAFWFVMLYLLNLNSFTRHSKPLERSQKLKQMSYTVLLAAGVYKFPTHRLLPYEWFGPVTSPQELRHLLFALFPLSVQ